MSHVRELDSRVTGGTAVILAWNSQDGSLSVVVQDDSNPENDLSVRVRDPAKALEVFWHPYAYAPEMRTR